MDGKVIGVWSGGTSKGMRGILHRIRFGNKDKVMVLCKVKDKDIVVSIDVDKGAYVAGDTIRRKYKMQGTKVELLNDIYKGRLEAFVKYSVYMSAIVYCYALIFYM
jgi:hypothetical protein